MASADQANPIQTTRPRVVVIGAGFGGINAVYGLRGAAVDITLIDRNNFHTFQPLLYQVSTAYLAADEVGSSMRSIFRRQKNVTVRVGAVTNIDMKQHTVVVDDGNSIDFDYLVIATGATTNFFGIPGLADHSWPLYSLSDAVRLRHHLLHELETIANGDKRTTVVVVGGGPTGVEMAGALSTMGRDLTAKTRQCRSSWWKPSTAYSLPSAPSRAPVPCATCASGASTSVSTPR